MTIFSMDAGQVHAGMTTLPARAGAGMTNPTAREAPAWRILYFDRVFYMEDLLFTRKVQLGSPFARQAISSTEYCRALQAQARPS